MNRTAPRRPGPYVLFVATFALAFVMVLPVLWTFLTSIKPPELSFVIPPRFLFEPSLESYRMAFTDPSLNLGHLARNSVVISVGTALATCAVSLLAAYGFSRSRMRGAGTVALIMIATRLLPPIALAVPLFLVFSELDLLDTQISVIATLTAFNIPFAVWMLRSFMANVPYELEEAAMTEGCTRLQSIVRVTLPLMAPGVAATAVFILIQAWNEFALVLILATSEAKTLPLAIFNFITDEGIMWGPMAAVATLILIPPVLFVIFAQRHMTTGLTLGAVKS